MWSLIIALACLAILVVLIAIRQRRGRRLSAQPTPASIRDRQTYGMKLSDLREYAIPSGASLTPKRDASIWAKRSQIVRPELDEDTVMRLYRDFDSWTGGFRPETIEDVDTYIATSMPGDINPEAARRFLIRWMESPEE